MTKTWLITGTSSGLGRVLTEYVLERGGRVAATLRDPSRLDELAERHEGRLWRGRLDVCDTEQVRTVVAEAFAELGAIDVVVSNAGIGVYGAAEELTDLQIDEVIATNLTGSIQLVRAVLPHLREQGGGRILQVSSMGGVAAFPGFSIYHATKWGIEGFFEALAPEVEAFGIETVLVEPGVVETPFYGSSPRAPVMDAYADSATVQRGRLRSEEMPGDPVKIAAEMVALATEADPPRRLLLGVDAFAHATAAWYGRLQAAQAARERSVGAVREGWTGPSSDSELQMPEAPQICLSPHQNEHQEA